MSKFITKSVLMAVISAVILFSSPASTVFAETASEAATGVEQGVQKGTEQHAAEKREAVLDEATQAIRSTQDALKALDEGKPEAALTALERATGKLEIILARRPELALAPADVSTVTHDVVATPEAIEELREAAEDALDDGQLQKARRLMQDLASEVTISVTNIPLASYPDAIRTAAALIEEEDFEQAAGVLYTALNTLVVTDTIVPLPVARAQVMLDEAASLAVDMEKGSAEEQQKLDGYLSGARRQLEIAELLGYGSEREFAGLYRQLDEIDDRVDEGDASEGLFARIHDLLDDTVESSQQESIQADS